jgi:hypothetical protein
MARVSNKRRRSRQKQEQSRRHRVGGKLSSGDRAARLDIGENRDRGRGLLQRLVRVPLRSLPHEAGHSMLN